MSLLEAILIVIVSFLFGLLGLGFFLNKKKLASIFESAQRDAKKILDQAQREADRMIKSAIQEGKEESRRRRKTFEEEAKKRKSEIHKTDQKLRQREENLENKSEGLEKRNQKLEALEEKLRAEEKNHFRLKAEHELSIERNQKVLEKLSNMSAEEARNKLMESLKLSAKKEAEEEIRKIEAEAKLTAQKKAKEVISLSVQRLSGEYVNDSTVSVVQLPNEEMKGRIIGREGRNIRAIEQATGVDLIIDDTPEAVIISCFNPVRREIAKATLEKLIADGRIHPARIEETVSRAEGDLKSLMKDYGEQAAFDIGITDFHPEIIALLGALYFKSVGLQSVLQHSVETANICGMMAGELELNIKKAKRAGLLHDIGKAIDQSQEGNHADIGAEVCQKYGEHDDIVSAVSLHHAEDLTNASALAVIVGAANNLSASRPGARKNILASYIKRLSDMEEVIKGFQYVEKAYVLQSGREVRVLVSPENMKDTRVSDLASNIVLKLRQELTFPGQVRVTVLKESKHIEYAT